VAHAVPKAVSPHVAIYVLTLNADPVKHMRLAMQGNVDLLRLTRALCVPVMMVTLVIWPHRHVSHAWNPAPPAYSLMCASDVPQVTTSIAQMSTPAMHLSVYRTVQLAPNNTSVHVDLKAVATYSSPCSGHQS